MMDRFLDRRMGLGRRGRDRIIRERTVHDKAKAGAKTVRAKGPKPDARLLANTASNGRLSREADIGRRSGRKGILSRAGGVAQAAGKAVTGTLAMGGKALGGMLRMLPGIGQALALGMAVYDGFQGWNDKELHQQAFGLKDGQEATTGQKASSAAASILDMGGLTSSLLGMFGIEFDKAGVARSIYELGSNIGQLASDVIGVGLPLLKSAWKGIEDFGSKIWQGAKDVGGSIAQFATGVWEKGTAFAADIGTWAKGAINDGVGIVTGIWNDAKSAVSGCWAKLSGFAEDSISKGGKILSDLWNSAKELPGKIIDGATDLAKGALETGGKLLSNGWNAVKNWGKGLFSSDEAKAEPVNQAELKPAPVAHQESAQKETAPIAHEAVAITDPVVKPETGNKASSIVDPAIDSKLSSINTEENAQKSATSSEAASSALALEQMKQNDIENKSREEIIDNLEQANKYINNISKLLGEEFRKDELPDEFGIAGALQNVSSAIESARYSGGGNTFYSGGGNAAYSGASGGSAASGVYAGFGDIVSMGETSGKGTAMVSTGKGDHGGVSYGRNQLASKAGSIPAAMKWARANGFEDIANQLEPLQGDATNYNGQFAQKWRQLAAEKGGRLEQFDRAYQKQGYYDPMMAKIRQSNPELAKRIEANPALQEQVLSTATQYGMNSSRYLSAANEALGKNANLSDRELLVAIQDIKARDVGINFAKSSKDVQRSIVNRHGKEEKQRLLALHDKFERGEIKIDPQTGTASVAGQNLHYDGSSQGVRLKDDGKTVDLSTVQGVESLRLQQGVNIDKMHPEAVSRLGRMAQDYEKITGQKLEISEGYRDYAEQVRVKKKYGADAATPGKSTHGMGNTFDIAKSKIVDVENRLKQAGINPVQFFKDHGFERSAYRPGASRKHDESWHLEATDLRTAEMQADREHRQSGKKTGAEYMTAEQRAKYMAPKIAPASPQALADNQANTAPETIQPTNDSQPVSNNSPVQVAEAQTSAENKLSESSSPVPQVAMTLEPASQGVSLAQANNAAPVGVPIRNPIDVPAIREIDPGREVKTSSNDNGPILKVLGEILAAIQAGNKKMANSGNNDGSPFISTEYDDPAAQGLAADSA